MHRAVHNERNEKSAAIVCELVVLLKTGIGRAGNCPQNVARRSERHEHRRTRRHHAAI